MSVMNYFLSFAFIIILLTGFLPLGNLLPSAYATSATGGTITYSGGKTIHTFNASGTFTVTTSGTVEYLVIAGGGGGGGGTNNRSGGGGGAGGYLTATGYTVTAQSYNVTIGAGGSGGATGGSGSNGGNSVFNTITSLGGGGGGYGEGGGAGGSGATGGSGGGGGGGISGNASGGSGTGGQGNNGGTGITTAGGGGGGAGGVGTNGGAGGVGTSSSITGSSVTRGAGGGGGSDTSGGSNTGGGGGGASGVGSGAPGGSGIVIIIYDTATSPSPDGSITGKSFALVATADLSKQKNNLGTTYADVYNDAFEPDFNLINFTGYSEARILSGWDYSSADTGNQQMRWVDTNNNTNVLYETSSFTIDQDPNDSGWIILPTWAKNETTIEWQGKSTVSADDPIAKYFRIFLK